MESGRKTLDLRRKTCKMEPQALALDGLHLRSIFCVSLDSTKRKVYGSTLLVSAFLGIIGSVFQLIVWKGCLKKHEMRHKPSSNPHAVFNLALGNAVSCLMSIVLALTMLFVHKPLENGMISPQISSQDIYWILPIQVFCDFGYISSALWTLAYLVDVSFQVHRIHCRVIIYYMLAWGLTIFFTVLVQVLRLTDKQSTRKCIPASDISCIVIVWISLIVLLMVLCAVTFYTIDKQVKTDVCMASNAYTANQRTIMQHIRAKFVFFLVIFFICWISTLIGGILVLSDYGPTVQQALSFSEAVLHPLQGVFDYFIFTPLRSGQNPVTYQGDRKSPLLPRGTIQQIYGTSYESSMTNSIAQTVTPPIVSSFHFTPCFPSDGSPLLTSFRSTDTLDDYYVDNNLKIGQLLGENYNNF